MVKSMNKVKGYIVLDNWCRGSEGLQYEVGKTYAYEGKPSFKEAGFHYCENLVDGFGHRLFCPENKVVEVSILGEVAKTEGVKTRVTNKLKVERQIEWDEVQRLVNTGIWNTGKGNSGNSNTGDNNTGSRNTRNYNSGDLNTGNSNSGDWNTGNSNSGNYNTGDSNTGGYNTGSKNAGDWNTGNMNAGSYNTGIGNAGDWNTGNMNAGSYNTGYFNVCSHSSGIFCTENQRMYSFNHIADSTIAGFKCTPTYKLLIKYSLPLVKWIDGEGDLAGYWEHNTYKEACQIWWSKYSEEEKAAIVKGLPNFDPDIFYEITGIEVLEKE